MGRPSLVAERREQILRAAAVCIARYGVDGATQERIAAQCGLSRPHVRHYVGNREQLLESVWRWVTAPYDEALARLSLVVDPLERLAAVLDFLFGPAFGPAEDDAVINAVIAAAARDERLRERVVITYSVLEEHVTAALLTAVAGTGPVAVADCAHALVCLAVGGSSLWTLPAPTAHRAGLRAQADVLVAALYPVATPRGD